MQKKERPLEQTGCDDGRGSKYIFRHVMFLENRIINTPIVIYHVAAAVLTDLGSWR